MQRPRRPPAAQMEESVATTLKIASDWKAEGRRSLGAVVRRPACIEGLLTIAVTHHDSFEAGVAYLHGKHAEELLARYHGLNTILLNAFLRRSERRRAPPSTTRSRSSTSAGCWAGTRSATPSWRSRANTEIAKYWPLTKFWTEYHRAMACLVSREAYVPRPPPQAPRLREALGAVSPYRRGRSRRAPTPRRRSRPAPTPSRAGTATSGSTAFRSTGTGAIPCDGNSGCRQFLPAGTPEADGGASRVGRRLGLGHRLDRTQHELGEAPPDERAGDQREQAQDPLQLHVGDDGEARPARVGLEPVGEARVVVRLEFVQAHLVGQTGPSAGSARGRPSCGRPRSPASCRSRGSVACSGSSSETARASGESRGRSPTRARVPHE